MTRQSETTAPQPGGRRVLLVFPEDPKPQTPRDMTTEAAPPRRRLTAVAMLLLGLAVACLAVAGFLL